MRETPNKPSKQATIKRYGWSDVSQSEALAHAKARVNEAHKRWLAGEDILRRERREEYNASNGIPIREQIISEHSFPEGGLPNNNAAATQLIVTRNSYGAQVANVNNIGVIDVDTIDLFRHLYPNDYFIDSFMGIWPEKNKNLQQSDLTDDSSNTSTKSRSDSSHKSSSMKAQVWDFVIASPVIASVIAWQSLSWLWLIAVMLAGTAFLWWQASKKGQAQYQADKKQMDTHLAELLPFMTDLIQKRVANHPAERFRLYQTPAGFRIIATHDVISPSDSVVEQWFAYFHADTNYVRLCQIQQCFRARLTAKPWRMNEVKDNHLAKDIPAKDFWFAEDSGIDDTDAQHRKELAACQQWMADYDNYAKNYRACHYIESIVGKEAANNSKAQASIDDFVRWHDSACQVNKGFEMA